MAELRMVLGFAIGAAAATFAGARGAAGDEVHLRDGGSIRGRVVDRGEKTVEVIHELGAVALERQEIAWIERAALPQDELTAKLAAIDLDDPTALRELALWAASNGLLDKARQVQAMARDRALERRLAEIEPGDARAYLELARWAKIEGLDRAVRRGLLERALEADRGGNDAAKREIAALEDEERAERAAAAIRAEKAKLKAEQEKLAAERRKLENERKRAERVAREYREIQERAEAYGRRQEVWTVMYPGAYGSSYYYGSYYGYRYYYPGYSYYPAYPCYRPPYYNGGAGCYPRPTPHVAPRFQGGFILGRR